VVVFSLPGAFTPTCSSSHVPRYEELHDELRARGVDDVLCVSVNDAFVMDAWREEQGARRVTFVPDGNGAFTAGMGMLVDKAALGFGQRSWRYSMLVRDGVIEKMFVEPEQPGDPFQVSDADTMLRYLGGKPARTSCCSRGRAAPTARARSACSARPASRTPSCPPRHASCAPCPERAPRRRSSSTAPTWAPPTIWRRGSRSAGGRLESSEPSRHARAGRNSA